MFALNLRMSAAAPACGTRLLKKGFP